MMLRALAGWLAGLPALAEYAAEGICTGTALPSPGCTLCDDGVQARSTDILGGYSEMRRYTLYVRSVCLREAERAALTAACEAAAGEIAARDAAGLLPTLPAPYCADTVRCAGQRLAELDDSGLALYEITLLMMVSVQGGDL